MDATGGKDLLERLARIPDPRGVRGRRHSAAAMLNALVCAVLRGARSLSAVVQWLHLQEPRTWHALGFYRTPPKDHAFRELLAAIDPQALERILAEWIAVREPASDPFPDDPDSRAVALDGKTLCGSIAAHRKAVLLLSLYSHRTGLVRSQCDVPPETNEAKAAETWAPPLLRPGEVVTVDAAFCQREFCKEVQAAGADYFVVVKKNQSELCEAIAADFQPAFSPLRRKGAAGASPDR